MSLGVCFLFSFLLIHLPRRPSHSHSHSHSHSQYCIALFHRLFVFHLFQAVAAFEARALQYLQQHSNAMGSGAGETFEARRIALAASSPVQAALDACVEELGFIRATVSAAAVAAAAAARADAAAEEKEERKGGGKETEEKEGTNAKGSSSSDNINKKNPWLELFSLVPRVASAIRGGVGLTTRHAAMRFAQALAEKVRLAVAGLEGREKGRKKEDGGESRGEGEGEGEGGGKGEGGKDAAAALRPRIRAAARTLARALCLHGITDSSPAVAAAAAAALASCLRLCSKGVLRWSVNRVLRLYRDGCERGQGFDISAAAAGGGGGGGGGGTDFSPSELRSRVEATVGTARAAGAGGRGGGGDDDDDNDNDGGGIFGNDGRERAVFQTGDVATTARRGNSVGGGGAVDASGIAAKHLVTALRRRLVKTKAKGDSKSETTSQEKEKEKDKDKGGSLALSLLAVAAVARHSKPLSSSSNAWATCFDLLTEGGGRGLSLSRGAARRAVEREAAWSEATGRWGLRRAAKAALASLHQA